MNLVDQGVLDATIERIVVVYAPEAPGVNAALTLILIDFFRDALTKLIETGVVSISIPPRADGNGDGGL